jgi:L-lysine 2,3-aminomutase
MSLLANYATEKFLNRLMGRTEVEDALQRLDMLTKEETGMTVAKNLALGHVVNDNVKVVEDTVRQLKTVQGLPYFVHVMTNFVAVPQNRNR